MIDLTGKKFGRLTVVDKKGKEANGLVLWNCLCECGTEKIIKGYNLKIGKTKSCGCLKTGVKTKDLSGKKYNRLTVLQYVGRTKNRGSLWKCICECGTIKILLGRAFVSGRQKSCGCFHKEYLRTLSDSNSPFWNPNLTIEDRIKRRNIPGLEEWSFNVKKAYNFICYICKYSKGNKLVSHHLNSWDIHPQQRLDLQNGVCLCEDCHKDFHHLYGFGQNTREQFEEWKSVNISSNYNKN